MRTLLRLLPFLSFLLGAAGCPAATSEAPSLRFPPETTLHSSSGRCQGRTCECRPLEGEGQSEEGVPAGHKRFEVRLPKTTSALWVSIGDKGVFYKGPETLQPACFYVDLPPGEHALTLHSERKDVEVGLQTGLALYEYGPKVGSWYHSLELACGGLEKCSKAVMEAAVAAQRALPRGVLDACGSTMIRGVTFKGTREERQLPEYVDLDLHLVVKIYAFETFRPPGAPDCRAPVKNL